MQNDARKIHSTKMCKTTLFEFNMIQIDTIGQQVISLRIKLTNMYSIFIISESCKPSFKFSAKILSTIFLLPVIFLVWQVLHIFVCCAVSAQAFAWERYRIPYYFLLIAYISTMYSKKILLNQKKYSTNRIYIFFVNVKHLDISRNFPNYFIFSKYW